MSILPITPVISTIVSARKSVVELVDPDERASLKHELRCGAQAELVVRDLGDGAAGGICQVVAIGRPDIAHGIDRQAGQDIELIVCPVEIGDPGGARRPGILHAEHVAIVTAGGRDQI